VSNNIVTVRGLSKSYAIPHMRDNAGENNGWRGWFAASPLGSREVKWVLDDINFDVTEAEIIGIIGRNGSGKSTLLKILSRIVRPSRGRATVIGRVGTLLEVGTGFHPDLSGRENIFLNGTLLGMSQAEIRARFDEIVDFSENEQFLDLPVKFYSSGMYARLAFSVAAHLDPEILIVDEVLSVGDTEFQKKCLGKMGNMTQAGRTVFFVSHNLAAVMSLCTRCLLLRSGRLVADDLPEIAIQKYVDTGEAAAGGEIILARPKSDPGVYVARAVLKTLAGNVSSTVEMGQPAILEIEYVVDRPQRDITMEILVSRKGVPLFNSFDTDTSDQLRGRREPGRYRARLLLPLQHFKQGPYTVEFPIHANRQSVLDPLAILAFDVVNHHRDLTHYSYRADRSGQCALDIVWETTKSETKVLPAE
jgi:lipopolysaccharide transport system ATP-binding protein